MNIKSRPNKLNKVLLRTPKGTVYDNELNIEIHHINHILVKYTGYLIKGNHSQFQQFTPKNSIGRRLWTIWIITFSLGMLGFCFMLLPLTFTTDMARSAYCLELKIVRKFNKKMKKVHKVKFGWQTMTSFVNRVASILF